MRSTTKTYNFTSYSGVYLQGTLSSTTTPALSATRMKHTMNMKAYEQSNHLGNVLVTISDARQISNSGASVTGFVAIVKSATDYSAFGAPLAGRTYTSSSYRYGMNGQEKDGEIAEGIYTAEFWEYDSRLGRRWNTDPVIKPHESSYAAFANNPIWFVDPLGRDSAAYTACGGGPEMSSGYDDGSGAAFDFSSTYSSGSGEGSGGTNATPENKYIPYTSSHFSGNNWGFLPKDMDEGGPGKSIWGAFEQAYYSSDVSIVVRPNSVQDKPDYWTATITGSAQTGNSNPGVFVPSATATMYVDGIAQSTQALTPDPNGSLWQSPTLAMGSSQSLGTTMFELPTSGSVTIEVNVTYGYWDPYGRSWLYPVDFPGGPVVSNSTTFTVITVQNGTQAPGPFIINHSAPDLTR